MFNYSVSLNNVNDIVGCLENFEALASAMGNKKLGFNSYLYLVPFYRNSDTGSVLAVGWTSGKPRIFMIHPSKRITADCAGDIGSLSDFLFKVSSEVAANISKEKMVSIVVDPKNNQFVETLYLFNNKGPFVEVINNMV